MTMHWFKLGDNLRSCERQRPRMITTSYTLSNSQRAQQSDCAAGRATDSTDPVAMCPGQDPVANLAGITRGFKPVKQVQSDLTTF
jgi:hypothetical protein